MKKKILICTIMRNQEANFENWMNQLKSLIHMCPEYEFTVSIYENDSSDRTKDFLWALKQFKDDVGAYQHISKNIKIVSENIGTKQYESIWSVDRIKNLANARQKCIDQVGHLEFDKIAYIEPDVSYDPNWCKELILAKHPEQAGIVPHVYSGWSLRSETHPKESCYLYDTCATRGTNKDAAWNFENESAWRNKSLVKTHLSNIDSNCLHHVWSTFNCFCVYNAEPFKRGIRWDYVNKRLNTGQEYVDDGDGGSGWLDADTSVICEDFRRANYGNVLLNTNCLIRHK